MSEETEMIECPECYGQGFIETTSPSHCSVPIADCCGGCYGEVDCDNCEGTGEIEE